MNIIKKLLTYISFTLSFLNDFLFKSKIRQQFSFQPYIISIGNITMGGTGKTPMVITLSRLLSRSDLNHIIVSRGYKRKNKDTIIVSGEGGRRPSIEAAGDEPFLLSKLLSNIPVLVGNKKIALDLGFKKFSHKIALIDDGFQSLEIKRDCDIVLVDLSRKIEEYRLFPLGLLREPLKNIKRADIIIFTKINYNQGDANKIENLIYSLINLKHTSVFKSRLISNLQKYSFLSNKFISSKKLANKNLVAFCGIAKPFIFKKLVDFYCKKRGALFTFKDHHNYSKKDIIKIKYQLKKINSKVILTTLKDFYKIINSFKGYTIYVINIHHEIENINDLKSLLLQKRFSR